MACVAFLIGATPLVVGAPWWAVTLLAVAWVVALLVAVGWFTERPRSVALLPVGLALLWLAVVLLGATQLGWA